VLCHRGAASGGTNNYAELVPFLQALWHFDATRRYPPGTGVCVLLVSDSELTVRCGEGRYRRTANLGLWAQVDYYARAGYQLTWRHVLRNSNPLNAEADHEAGRLRQAFATILAGRTEPAPHDERSCHAGHQGEY
jgi:ribonuclease HI